MIRILSIIVLSLAAVTLRAETETGPQPRLLADFDLTEYVGPGKAKTTEITARPVAAKAEAAKIPPYLGVQFVAAGKELRVAQVDTESPAYKAGLRTGDIVTKLDGKSIASLAELRDLILARAAGTSLSFEIAGKKDKIAVALAAVSAPRTGTGGGNSRPVLGIRTEPDDKGMKIVRLTPGMPAEKAGLKESDIIVEINGTKTSDLERINDAIEDKKVGDKVQLLVLRGKEELRKEVTLAEDTSRGFPSGLAGMSWDTRQGRTFQKNVYKLAVLPMSFKDLAINAKITGKHWEEALFSTGTYNAKNAFGSTVYGSMNDYYREISCGKFSVEGKVFEPVTVSKNRSEYANDSNRNALLGEAIDALRKRDGAEALKGYDGIFYMYAGSTAASQRGGLFWPHKSNFQHKGEGITYFIVPEGGRTMSNISTITHEFGHMLGLPDLYAKPEVPEMEGVGSWCAMSQQARNGRPQHFSAWSKERLGWVKPAVIDPEVPQKLILSPIEGSSDQCIKVLVKPDGSEYLLLENRLRTGFDKSLPGEGLLVWRVVDGKVTLEESHGVAGQAGPRSYLNEVPYPSKANTAFTPNTTPSSKPVKKDGKAVWITNIRKLPDNRIAFQIGYEYF